MAEQRLNALVNVVCASLLVVWPISVLADESHDASPSQPLVVASQAMRDNELIQRQPAAAYGDGVYLVVWCDGRRYADDPTTDIYGARIDAATGRSLDPKGIVICSARDLQEWPKVAFDGDNFLVVWQDMRSGTAHDVYAARVSSAGKVLDRDGFVVAEGHYNQARPSVAATRDGWLVVWMDIRNYPVYGIYGARVSPGGKVLDPHGIPLDVEDADKVAAARPSDKQWLGDHDYWWNKLGSRGLPVVASDATRNKCLVAYSRAYHPYSASARPSPTVLVVEAKTGRPKTGPKKLTGGIYDSMSLCTTTRGWGLVLLSHEGGWGTTPRLAVIRLDAELNTNDAFAQRNSGKSNSLPVEDLSKSLKPEDARELNPGKGAIAFWQAAAAFDGERIIAATDYGWRDRRDANAITYVIAVNRVSIDGKAFVDPASRTIVTTKGADQAVANPALVSGPNGSVLLLYEHDTAIDRQVIEAQWIRD